MSHVEGKEMFTEMPVTVLLGTSAYSCKCPHEREEMVDWQMSQQLFFMGTYEV